MGLLTANKVSWMVPLLMVWMPMGWIRILLLCSAVH